MFGTAEFVSVSVEPCYKIPSYTFYAPESNTFHNGHAKSGCSVLQWASSKTLCSQINLELQCLDFQFLVAGVCSRAGDLTPLLALAPPVTKASAGTASSFHQGSFYDQRTYYYRNSITSCDRAHCWSPQPIKAPNKTVRPPRTLFDMADHPGCCWEMQSQKGEPCHSPCCCKSWAHCWLNTSAADTSTLTHVLLSRARSQNWRSTGTRSPRASEIQEGIGTVKPHQPSTLFVLIQKVDPRGIGGLTADIRNHVKPSNEAEMCSAEFHTSQKQYLNTWNNTLQCFYRTCVFVCAGECWMAFWSPIPGEALSAWTSSRSPYSSKVLCCSSYYLRQVLYRGGGS